MPEIKKLVFLYDKDGNEYACPADALQGEVKDGKELSEEERKKCLDLTDIFGSKKKSDSP